MAPSKDIRKLSIKIHSDLTGPNGLPLVKCVPGEPPVLHATFIFENMEDSQGRDVTARFEVSMKKRMKLVYLPGVQGSNPGKNVHVLAEREWKISVPPARKSGYLAKGMYTKQIAMMLEPSMPCSTALTTDGGCGWVTYKLSLTVSQTAGAFSFRSPFETVEQEFWAVVPGVDTLAASIPRSVHFTMGKDSPISCHIPSSRLYLGEVVPFRFVYTPPPLTEHCKQIVIKKATIVLCENTDLQSTISTPEMTGSRDVVEAITETGWPGSLTTDPWERTIFIAVPDYDKITPSFLRIMMKVTHSFKVTITYCTREADGGASASTSGEKTHTWKEKFDVHVGGVETDRTPEALPPYSNEKNIVVSDGVN